MAVFSSGVSAATKALAFTRAVSHPPSPEILAGVGKSASADSTREADIASLKRGLPTRRIHWRTRPVLRMFDAELGVRKGGRGQECQRSGAPHLVRALETPGIASCKKQRSSGMGAEAPFLVYIYLPKYLYVGVFFPSIHAPSLAFDSAPSSREASAYTVLDVNIPSRRGSREADGQWHLDMASYSVRARSKKTRLPRWGKGSIGSPHQPELIYRPTSRDLGL